MSIAIVHVVYKMNVASATWPPALRLSQLTWAMSSLIVCYRPHLPSPFIIITQPKYWYSFCRSTEGRRLSRPRQCGKGVQPVPTAVYQRGCHDRHIIRDGTGSCDVWHCSQACYHCDVQRVLSNVYVYHCYSTGTKDCHFLLFQQTMTLACPEFKSW